MNFKIGNGSSFSLYFDPQCEGKSLSKWVGNHCFNCLRLPHNIPLDAIINNGKWVLPIRCLHCSQCKLLFSLTTINTRHDIVLWQNNHDLSTRSIKEDIFSSHPNFQWDKFIQHKGHAINYVVFYWMTLLKGLKTSHNFAARGLGTTITCCLCDSTLESHNYLFFNCSFAQQVIRIVLHRGSFFLLEPSLSDVLLFGDTLEHKIISRIYFLFVSILVYMLWHERNNRLFKNKSSSISLIITNIIQQVLTNSEIQR